MTASRPRVLQIVTSLAVGGAQRHLLELLPGLRQFADIDLVYFRDHDLRPEFEACVERIAHIPMAGPFGAVRLPLLATLIRRGRYTLVHTHLLRADMYGALAARAVGVRAIMSSKHNIEARLESAAARAIHALATRPTRRTIAISEAVAGWTNQQLGVPSDRIEVIRYGLDAAPFSGLDRAAARRELGVEAHAPLLLCPARLDPQKRHDVLLRAFARVRRKLGNAQLLCAGETQLGGPAYRARLLQLTDDLGLRDAVRWLGVRSDIPNLMAAADVVVLASDWEGLGLVVMEAAMASRPVVATAVGGVPEIVEHNKTGLLVPQGDEQALASELTAVLLDTERRVRMGSGARRHAAEAFDLEGMRAATRALYASVIRDVAA
ncbi:MAG: glycosyltransferase [Chloroflexi bacterium]|nr:glycosyltransferase [Chloroflexota bacterium]